MRHHRVSEDIEPEREREKGEEREEKGGERKKGGRKRGRERKRREKGGEKKRKGGEKKKAMREREGRVISKHTSFVHVNICSTLHTCTHDSRETCQTRYKDQSNE